MPTAAVQLCRRLHSLVGMRPWRHFIARQPPTRPTHKIAHPSGHRRTLRRRPPGPPHAALAHRTAPAQHRQHGDISQLAATATSALSTIQTIEHALPPPASHAGRCCCCCRCRQTRLATAAAAKHAHCTHIRAQGVLQSWGALPPIAVAAAGLGLLVGAALAPQHCRVQCSTTGARRSAVASS